MKEPNDEVVTNRPEAAWSSVPATASDLVVESGAHLDRYWDVLNRNKGLLLAGIIVGSILGFCATLPALEVYQARTSLEIAGLNDNFLNIKQSDPVSYAESRTDDLETQVAILKSNSLLERVSAKLGSAPPRTK